MATKRKATLLADGRYQIKVPLPNGKRKSVYGRSEREAQKAADDLVAQSAGGIVVPDKRETLCQFLTGHKSWPAFGDDGQPLPPQGWLGSVVAISVRPSAYIRYEQNLRNHIIPAIGGVRLVKLCPEHIQQMIADKIGEGLAPRTVKQMVTVLHGALGVAMRWRRIPYNPADAVIPPKVEKAEVAALQPMQCLRLLALVTGTRLEGIVTLMLTTGLRLAEVAGLRWEDVDLEERVIRVRQQIRRVKITGLVASAPKSKSSRRPIVLTNIGIEALYRQRSRIEVMQMAVGDRWTESGLVFPNTRGKAWEPRGIEHSLDRVLACSDLPRVTPHGLRHSTATLLRALHVDPKTVQEILGHTQIGLTMDTYTDYVPEDHQQAMKAMNGYLERFKTMPPNGSVLKLSSPTADLTVDPA